MDIVEWLRQFKLSTSDSNYNALVVNGKTEEAADEIERLRQLVNELNSVAYVIDGHGVAHHNFTIVYRELE